MKLPLVLFLSLSSSLVSCAPQPRGDPLFGGLISGLASPIIGFKKGLLGLFHGNPAPQAARPQRPRPVYARPAPVPVYARPAPAPAPAYAPAPAPAFVPVAAPAYAPAPKPEIPILPAPDLSGGPESVDEYGSPAAPVAPVAPAVVVKAIPAPAEPEGPAPQVEVASIVDLKSDDLRSAKSLSSNVPQINIIQVEEVDFKPINVVDTFETIVVEDLPVVETTFVEEVPVFETAIISEVPVFETAGPQVPISQDFPVFETIVEEVPVFQSLPPIIIDLTSSEVTVAPVSIEAIETIAHIPGQPFEPIVEVREPKILIEEPVEVKVLDPVLITTSEPEATTQGPIIIDLVTSDVVEEIAVEQIVEQIVEEIVEEVVEEAVEEVVEEAVEEVIEEVVNQVVDLRSDEEIAIVEVVTEKEIVPTVEEVLIATIAPVVEITEVAVELTDAPVVDITEQAVIQNVDTTAALLVEIIEQAVNQVTTVQPVEETTRQKVVFRTTEAPELEEAISTLGDDAVDATTLAATTVDVRQPKALDSDVEIGSGIETNEVLDSTTRQKVVFQTTEAALNLQKIVFTTGHPDFTTGFAGDFTTAAPLESETVPATQAPQAVHKFVFRLRKPAGSGPSIAEEEIINLVEGGAPIAEEEIVRANEIINLVEGGQTQVLDTIPTGFGDVQPVVELILPQDQNTPVLIPLLDRDAGVFPTDQAPVFTESTDQSPSFTAIQEDRAPKSFGEETDPAFLEASSNAEPNDPVPRNARDHYYQHQYTDKYANWYYFRHGF